MLHHVVRIDRQAEGRRAAHDGDRRDREDDRRQRRHSGRQDRGTMVFVLLSTVEINGFRFSCCVCVCRFKATISY